jgi:hypothetical protein
VQELTDSSASTELTMRKNLGMGSRALDRATFRTRVELTFQSGRTSFGDNARA